MSNQTEQSKKTTGQILALLMKNDNDPPVNLAALTIAACVLAHAMKTPKETLVNALNDAWTFVEITTNKAPIQ